MVMTSEDCPMYERDGKLGWIVADVNVNITANNCVSVDR